MKNRLMRLSLVVILTGALAGVFPNAPAALAAETAKPAEQADFQRLAGQWVRPDGGYVLELKDIKKDGSLKASYFNPRPINVAKAELKKKDGTITLFVELRDVNYPGSTYTLQYDPKGDLLTGIYYQALQKQTFDVMFQRVR